MWVEMQESGNEGFAGFRDRRDLGDLIFGDRNAFKQCDPVLRILERRGSVKYRVAKF
jgi:hypothetical protein